MPWWPRRWARRAQAARSPAAAAVRRAHAQPRNRSPTRRAGARRPALQRLVGRTESMQQVHAMVGKVARSMAPVLVQGESGTGKELVARAVHELSSRAAGPFIAVNCGAIPETLLEAEFFGYRKGAFTGAAEDREGFFQAAQGGTLFLDEIGDLPLSMQSKLLRVIQERAVRPIGAVNEVPVNVRIVSATHRDLGDEVHAGRFRQDLYYRLNVIGIRLPPLRERAADLAPICRARAGAHRARCRRDAGADDERRGAALAVGLCLPGQRARAREPAAARAGAVRRRGHRAAGPGPGRTAAPREPVARGARRAAAAAAAAARRLPSRVGLRRRRCPSDLQAYLDEVERDILVRALERYRYNRTAAGASMGLSLRQMRYRMARLGVIAGEGLGERGDPR